MKRTLIQTLMICLLFSACAPKQPAQEFTAPPNPLTVQAQNDNGQASTALISIDGGTLSATAADGTRFTLTLPKDALLQDTDITLTPVTQIDGLPLDGGLVAAVQIEPDGLDLLQPATLTIELSSPLPSDELLTVGFAYEGSGAEFHLTPSSVEGQTITYSLYHFSGHGSGRGTKANVQKQKKNHPPTKPRDRVAQEITDPLLDPLKPGASLEDLFYHTVEPLLKESIAVEAAGGEGADKVLMGALHSFEQWVQKVKEASLQGDFDVEMDLGYRQLVQAIKSALDDAYKRCVEKDDIEQWNRMEKWLIEWTFFPSKYQGDLSDYEAKDDECSNHFKLKIEISIDQQSATSRNHESSQADVSIALQRGGTFTGQGSGPVSQELKWWGGGADCISTSNFNGTYQTSGILEPAAHALEVNFVFVTEAHADTGTCNGITSSNPVPATTVELPEAYTVPSQAGQPLEISEPREGGSWDLSVTLLASR